MGHAFVLGYKQYGLTLADAGTYGTTAAPPSPMGSAADIAHPGASVAPSAPEAAANGVSGLPVGYQQPPPYQQQPFGAAVPVAMEGRSTQK